MKDTLYYDGKCPLCAKEISLLRKLKDASLELIDIHNDHYDSTLEGKVKGELLSILHFKTSKGDWLYGVDASLAAWQHTPYGWILMPLRWPLINIIVDRIYYKWANNRACRLGYKDDGHVVESR